LDGEGVQGVWGNGRGWGHRMGDYLKGDWGLAGGSGSGVRGRVGHGIGL